MDGRSWNGRAKLNVLRLQHKNKSYVKSLITKKKGLILEGFNNIYQ